MISVISFHKGKCKLIFTNMDIKLLVPSGPLDEWAILKEFMVASDHIVEFQTLVGVFGLISLLSHPDQFDCVLPSACHPLWTLGASPNL